MPEYCISWWNVENLFDIENSPNRSEKLERVLKRELKGWNQEILDKKISQISKIISRINDGNGPDIIGICEVENKAVVERLSDKLNGISIRVYKFAHENTIDNRGIDVAFLYDSTKFDIEKG